MTIKCNERTQDNEKWKITMSQIHLPILINNYLSIKNLRNRPRLTMSQIHLPILINNYLSIKNLLNRTRLTSVNVIL